MHFKKRCALHFKTVCRHFKIAMKSFQAKPQLRNSLTKGLNTVTNNIIVDLSMDFSVAIVNICDSIKGKSVIVNQILRSGTSIGANIHEANYASSRADFIAKMQIPNKDYRLNGSLPQHYYANVEKQNTGTHISGYPCFFILPKD